MSGRTVFAIILAAFLFSVSAVFAEDRLVPSEYPDIQFAIELCNSGDTIIMSPGTYTGFWNRDLDFLGKAITVRSIDPNDPCVVAATVIDCNGSEAEPHRGFYFHNNEGVNSVVAGLTITGGFGHFETVGDYNVPIGGGIYCYQSSPTIKNCIIKDNIAYRYDEVWDGDIGGFGGGIYCYQSNSEIENCIIENNKVGDGGYAFGIGGLGGGIYGKNSNLVISNCTITDNETNWIEVPPYDGWYSGGGGIYLYGGGSSIIRDCNINGNYCGYAGGGIYCSPAEIENCEITNNSSDGYGGGICGNTVIRESKIIGNWAFMEGGGIDSESSSIVSNCIIAQNAAAGDPDLWGGIEAKGGGIRCSGGTQIINCTITENQYYWGSCGGIYCTGSPTVENCIVWGNYGAEIANGSPVVTYSDVQGGWAGTGNIDADPHFVGGGDFHLIYSSPCFNAGDPNYIAGPNETDIDGDERIQHGRIDIGADEAECYAGMPDYVQWELFGKPECWCYPRQCLGDADGLPHGEENYWVSSPDLAILKSAWQIPNGPTGEGACADFDHLPYGKRNYRVAAPDLMILKSYWQIANGPDPNCEPGNRNP